MLSDDDGSWGLIRGKSAAVHAIIFLEGPKMHVDIELPAVKTKEYVCDLAGPVITTDWGVGSSNPVKVNME
jgi:hypothetical protein